MTNISFTVAAVGLSLAACSSHSSPDEAVTDIAASSRTTTTDGIVEEIFNATCTSTSSAAAIRNADSNPAFENLLDVFESMRSRPVAP